MESCVAFRVAAEAECGSSLSSGSPLSPGRRPAPNSEKRMLNALSLRLVASGDLEAAGAFCRVQLEVAVRESNVRVLRGRLEGIEGRIRERGGRRGGGRGGGGGGEVGPRSPLPRSAKEGEGRTTATEARRKRADDRELFSSLRVSVQQIEDCEDRAESERAENATAGARGSKKVEEEREAREARTEKELGGSLPPGPPFGNPPLFGPPQPMLTRPDRGSPMPNSPPPLSPRPRGREKAAEKEEAKEKDKKKEKEVNGQKREEAETTATDAAALWTELCNLSGHDPSSPKMTLDAVFIAAWESLYLGECYKPQPHFSLPLPSFHSSF